MAASKLRKAERKVWFFLCWANGCDHQVLQPALHQVRNYHNCRCCCYVMVSLNYVNIHTYAHNLIRYASSEALLIGNSPTPRPAGSREGKTFLGEGEMVVRCMPECQGMLGRSRWTLLGRGLSYRNSPEREGGEGRGGGGREERKLCNKIPKGRPETIRGRGGGPRRVEVTTHWVALAGPKCQMRGVVTATSTPRATQCCFTRSEEEKSYLINLNR